MKKTSLRITREGWYYLGMMGFIIAGAVIRDINLLYIMAGMMLGPLLFSLYAAHRSLKRLVVRRRFEPMVAAGESLHIELVASKPKSGSRGLAVRVQDTIRREGDAKRLGQKASTFFPLIRANTSEVSSYCVKLSRRGTYHLGPLRASTGMPLGLVRAEVVSDEQESIKVSPKLGQLQPAWSRTIQQKDDGGQQSIHRRGRAEGDFYGMREWRNGDSRNWIHWRTSAKRMKLTVRQFQQPISQDLVVVLDLYDPENSVDDELAEQAISFVATLVVEQRKHGSTQMSVASASARSFSMQGNSSPVFVREVLERLAEVDAVDEDQLPMLLAEVLPRATPNSKIVLVSLTPRDLKDTDRFAELWQRTEARRSVGSIIAVSVGAPDFAELFQPIQSGVMSGEDSTSAELAIKKEAPSSNASPGVPS